MGVSTHILGGQVLYLLFQCVFVLIKKGKYAITQSASVLTSVPDKCLGLLYALESRGLVNQGISTTSEMYLGEQLDHRLNARRQTFIVQQNDILYIPALYQT